MDYTKPFLAIDAQADLLIARGLIGDRDLIISKLSSVSYYRLSGYWYPFRNPADDTFLPGTKFDFIWSRYVFDRKMRLLVMDAIERIEVAVRTRLAYHHAQDYGPFAYGTQEDSLPNGKDFEGFRQTVLGEYGRSRDRFVRHFRMKYGDKHECLPIWMAVEVMSFGTVLTFFRSSSKVVKERTAAHFGVASYVFENWLLALNTVRNICAHHSRLWNRVFGVKPLISRHQKTWHQPIEVSNDRLFGLLTVCKFCIDRVAPQSSWRQRVRALIAASNSTPAADMGFPDNWEECPIWMVG